MRFSGRVSGASDENSIATAARSMRSAGIDIINLSDSNPTVHGLSPGGMVEALSSPASLIYSPVPRGLESARQALALRFGGCASSYFLTASTSEAYSWVFKLLCDPGDTVLVPRPGYPLFDHLAGLEAIHAESYRLDYSHPQGWSIDMGSLRSAATRTGAKAIVVINPNNPTGSFLSVNERSSILALCGELGMALIADEVFFPYSLDARLDRSRLGGETGCLTFTLDGLSKLLCLPQLKLGWIRVSGPAEDVVEAEARLEVIADTFLSAGTPVMHALPTLLGQADVLVATVCARLKANLAAARSIFEYAGSPFRILRCEGAWTALLEYPRYEPEEAIVLGLLEHEHVAIQPGYFFDMERDGYLALSLVLEPGRFLEGIKRVRRHIDSRSCS
jgi:aspartate/methionine/tyrosine aminotransferase